VADFGIALAVQEAGGSRMTQTGISLGSPQYMSPEQAMAERAVDGRTDIYSLGVVLYEMLLGEPPFTGPTAQAISAKVMTERPAPLSGRRDTVPDEVEAAVLKAVSRYPADRFATAGDFAAALVARPVSLRSGERVVTPRAATWKMLAPWTAAGAACVVAGALWFRPTPYAPMIQYQLVFDSTQAPLTSDNGSFDAQLTGDGSKLVYRGPSKTGGQLWVQSFDRLKPVPVAGTEGAAGYGITTSPDNAWIAFSRLGRLWKVPLSGGSAVPLTADAGGPGAAWLDDGTIIYPSVSPSGDLVLRRVGADGGLSQVLPLHVVEHAGARVRGGLWGVATALPQSRGVIVWNCLDPGCATTMQTWVVDLASGEVRWLADDVAGAWYLRGGYMGFVTKVGGVEAQRFSLRALTTAGSRVRLFEGLQFSPEDGASFGATINGTVYYRIGDPTAAADAQELVWVTRDGGVSLVDSTFTFSTSPYRSLALSPDGARVALTLGSSDDVAVWVKRLPHGPLSRLTTSAERSFAPGWTADGKSVTYVMSDGSLAQSRNALHMRNADGTGPDSMLLRMDTRGVNDGFLTADGRWIVGRTWVLGKNSDIVGRRVGADRTIVPLVKNAAVAYWEPTVSPNGKWLAYVSSETGRYEVYIRPFPGTDVQKFPISARGGQHPRWAHSGRELFYLKGDESEMMVVPVSPDPPFRSAEPRVLFHVGKDLSHIGIPWYNWFDVSPDDQRFIMMRNVSGAAPRVDPIVVIHNLLGEVEARMKGK
ncbi:MAG: protein kinase, partial [Gemmatimonadaceae bacterium]